MFNRQLPRTFNTVCFKFYNCSDIKQTAAENIFKFCQHKNFENAVTSNGLLLRIFSNTVSEGILQMQ